MMKRAFTLMELLVVISIMALLGTISVGGYRALTQGMEERGVLQNVNQFVRSAYQRAQIDRQPVSVYYWNETLQSETDYQPSISVGRAVAVRRMGRLSYVSGGTLLHDEFGDLNRYYPQTDDSDSQRSGMFLYKLSGGSQMERSVVSQNIEKEFFNEMYLSGLPNDDREAGEITSYAFKFVDPGSASWQKGDAYGFEFAEITLPHNYIFGNQFSRDTSNPVKGEGGFSFSVSGNAGSGSTGGLGSGWRIDITAIRAGQSGDLEAISIGSVDDPTRRLE